METIKTERLILRPWQEEDIKPIATLNADPCVMEFFPKTLTPSESDHLARRIAAQLAAKGWGLWAVGVMDSAPFIGLIGIEKVPFSAPFTPAIEIGWRLAHPFWGRGYATEGALASLRYGFETLGLSEIVSFTPVDNHRSRKVMEKTGMHRNLGDDFDHPKLLKEDRLQRHVLYRLSARQWKQKWS